MKLLSKIVVPSLFVCSLFLAACEYVEPETREQKYERMEQFVERTLPMSMEQKEKEVAKLTPEENEILGEILDKRVKQQMGEISRVNSSISATSALYATDPVRAERLKSECETELNLRGPATYRNDDAMRVAVCVQAKW